MGSLHFGGPTKLEIQQSEGASYKITTFWLLWGSSLHFGGPRSRTSSRSEGALVQNRQLLGFCGVSLHFGGPRSRKSSKSQGALEIASAKGADSTKSTTFGLLWCSLHFSGPTQAGNPANPKGPGNGLQNRQLLGFCGVPSISAVPEAGNPNPKRLEMASAKGAGSTKSTTFGLFWCSLHFGLIWVDHGVESTRAGRFCRNKPVRQQNWLRSIGGRTKTI